jgi:hypothetical protein
MDAAAHKANMQRIRAAVRQFVEQLGVGGMWHAEDLRNWVIAQTGTAPSTPDRRLRELRQMGAINYEVVDAHESLYRVLEPTRKSMTPAILFNLKKKTTDKTCCDANRCTERTHSTVPGDLWARDEVGLCARHISLAATFSEQNPDYAPVVETPASTALVKAPVDGVLLPPTWGERVTAIIAQVQSDAEVAELTLKEAQALSIESHADMEKAADLVRDVKTMRDDIETWEKEVTRPVNAVAKRIRELLAPAKLLWTYAETELRGKLAKAALLEHDRNQKLMQEAARTHAEGGDVTPVMEQLTTSTDLDGVSIKIIWKATIQDVTLMPDEYVIRLPDNKKLKEYAASFEGAEPTAVPGVLFERDAPTRVQGR